MLSRGHYVETILDAGAQHRTDRRSADFSAAIGRSTTAFGSQLGNSTLVATPFHANNYRCASTNAYDIQRKGSEDPTAN
jgi:hypothetical protein